MTSTSKKRALLVDDYLFTRSLLRRVLESLSVEVLEADDGVVAWNTMETAYKENNPIDIVFTDLSMPNMDGLKFIKKSKEDSRFKHITFIIVTGQRDNAVILSSLSAGAADYILKPLVLEEVTPRVQVIMNRLK